MGPGGGLMSTRIVIAAARAVLAVAELIKVLSRK